MKTHGLQIVAYSCATCDKKFVLKNKLEEHLRKFGHVAEVSKYDIKGIENTSGIYHL